MHYERHRPKVVRQSTPEHCWAAALESWLDVTPGHAKLTQDKLITLYGSPPKGGLDPVKSFDVVAQTVGMSYQFVKLAEFSADFVLDKLRKRGGLYIVFKVQSGWSHAVILYGVHVPNGDEPSYKVMDPAPLTAGLKSWHKVDFFPVDSWLLIAWPSY